MQKYYKIPFLNILSSLLRLSWVPMIVSTLNLAPSRALAGDSLFFKSGVIATAPSALSDLPKAAKHEPKKAKSLFIVQFKTAIDGEDQKNLETLGAKILYYVPEDAFLIEATTMEARTIGVSSLHVKTVLPFLAASKLSPQLDQHLNGRQKNESEFSLVRVHFAPVSELASLQAKLRGALDFKRKEPLASASDSNSGDQVNEASDESWILTADAKLISKLAAVECIDWIEPSQPTEPAIDLMADAADSLAVNENEADRSLALAEIMKVQNITDPSVALTQGLRLHSAHKNLVGALVIDEKKGLSAGEEHIYPLDVHHAGHLRITLMYVDAPLAPFAEIDHVNHLELKILDHHGQSVPFKSLSSSGSVELKVASGSYEIHVKGLALPQVIDGVQPYALIVSAD